MMMEPHYAFITHPSKSAAKPRVRALCTGNARASVRTVFFAVKTAEFASPKLLDEPVVKKMS